MANDHESSSGTAHQPFDIEVRENIVQTIYSPTAAVTVQWMDLRTSRIRDLKTRPVACMESEEILKQA